MEGMKNFETFDQFLDATQDLLFPIPQGEKKSDYHGEGWNACYARMEKLVETENENSMLRDLLQNRMPAGAIAETTYQPILDKNEELIEANEEYIAANHELEKEIKQLKEQIEFLKNEKGLEEDAEHLRKEREQLRDWKNTLEKENKKLKEEHKTYKRIAEKFEKKRQGQFARMNKLEEELACVTSQRDTFGDMIKSKN